MNFDQARFNMIEQQIRPWNVLDAQILQVLSRVKREAYVPAAAQSLAFSDTELPIGDVSKGQLMLAPKIQARMVQDLGLKASDKVLEIGTGTGYTAALMAQLCSQVTTLEIDPSLAEAAAKNLMRQGVGNVDVTCTDGSSASFDGFDVVVLSGSVQSLDALHNRLPVGVTLAAVVGDAPMMRFTKVVRAQDGSVTTTTPWDTVAPRLLGFGERSIFEF